MLSNKIAFLALVLVLIAVAAADPRTRVIIHKNERFCILLPRTPGSKIVDSLKKSVSYCTSLVSEVRYAKELPSGFVERAYYKEAKDLSYSQVTGTFDPDTFSLSSRDNGGMASPRRPDGAQCLGFKYFIQFVEPRKGFFCIRCCHNKRDCPIDKAYKGCRAVIPGKYY